MATTNIKGFLLTFSFSPRFWELWRSKWNRKGSSCVHMWTSRACIYNKCECTKCYVFGLVYTAVSFHNEDSSYYEWQLGVSNGQQLWKMWRHFYKLLEKPCLVQEKCICLNSARKCVDFIQTLPHINDNQPLHRYQQSNNKGLKKCGNPFQRIQE